MEIQIESLRGGESLYEANRILFRLYSRKRLVSLAFVLVAATILLIPKLNSGDDASQGTRSFETNFSYSIDNFYHTLGVAFLLVFLLQLIGYFRQRNSFFTMARRIRDRRRNSHDRSTVKITERAVHYQNFEITQESKWSIYSAYLFYKNYVFLFPSASPLWALSVDLSQVSPADLNELRNFLKSKLPERKISRLI